LVAFGEVKKSGAHADKQFMGRPLTRRRFLGATAVVVLLTGICAAWIELRVGGARATLWIDDGLTPLAALGACVLCVRARALHEGRMRLFWTLLACATGAWTFAEMVWGYYALILDVEVPVPSWADVGYLSAIPLALAALVVHPATRGGGARRARSVLDGLVLATALMFLSWTLVLGPLWRTEDLSTWTGVVTLAYPFGDIVIVFFIVLAIRGMRGGDRLSLWCLLAALLAMALSDSTYTYLVDVANYTSPDPIDTGWVAAYLGIALAAYSTRPHGAEAPSAELAPPSLASLTAPLFPVLIALSAAAVEIRLDHSRLDRTAWLMAFGLIALVLVRQALIGLELLGSSRHPRSGGLMRRLAHATIGEAGAEGQGRSG
jgi:hypothetical protein